MIINSLYGAFDGYNYSGAVFFSNSLMKIKEVDPELAQSVINIFETIEKYPKTLQPNGQELAC